MHHSAPTGEIAFIMDHVAGYGAVAASDRFSHAGGETRDDILAAAARLAAEVLAPLNPVGDAMPARLENGVVRTPPGFAGGWRALAEGGWIGMTAPAAAGGMDLPQALAIAAQEILGTACPALQMAALLAQGQIEALVAHADPGLRDLVLPQVAGGAWLATMNLTEPQAGSDVGALATRAVPRPDGSHAITGQKIYISWGDADFAANVAHLVLARLPDAPAGTRGISLFLVPRDIPQGLGDGAGGRNALRVVGLERKLGLHGAPTATMAYEGAAGWLVGAPHRGMAAMFTMMNNARLGVGVQGVAAAQAALQLALAHARTRVQGTPGLRGTGGAIADHVDVRRMLAVMQAEVTAARALALATAVALDLAAAEAADGVSGPGAPAGGWAARAAFLIPICKAHCTDTGIAVANMGVQVHGGAGYVETPGGGTSAAQVLRDVRVTAIYEGTNGIQALDLVGRKLADGGAAAFALIDEIAAGGAAVIARGACAGLATEAQAVARAAAALRAGTAWLLDQGPLARQAGAVAYLRAWARVLGGHYHLRSAAAASGHAGRRALAQVFIGRLLPEHAAALAEMQAGEAPLLALPPDVLQP